MEIIIETEAWWWFVVLGVFKNQGLQNLTRSTHELNPDPYMTIIPESHNIWVSRRSIFHDQHWGQVNPRNLYNPQLTFYVFIQSILNGLFQCLNRDFSIWTWNSEMTKFNRISKLQYLKFLSSVLRWCELHFYFAYKMG